MNGYLRDGLDLVVHTHDLPDQPARPVNQGLWIDHLLVEVLYSLEEPLDGRKRLIHDVQGAPDDAGQGLVNGGQS